MAPINPPGSGSSEPEVRRSRGRFGRIFVGSRDLVRIVWRDPEHVSERITLYALDRLGGPSEASQCVPTAHFSDHWFGFTAGGRHFHADVAFGPHASATTRAQAWTILDTLRVDPAIRPDWPASG